MSEFTPVEQELADAVYEFLVVEGYHAHYPSAEEAAETFVRRIGKSFVDRLATAYARDANLRDRGGDMSEKPEHDLVLIQKEGVLLLECRVCHELVENLGFETTPLVMNSAGIRHYREKNEDLQAAVRAVEKFEEDST